MHVELDERGFPLRLILLPPETPRPRRQSLGALWRAFGESAAEGSRLVALYASWIVLLVGTLYLALLGGRALAGALAMSCLSTSPHAGYCLGATLGFAAWIAVWLWHLTRLQSLPDEDPDQQPSEACVVWEEDICA